MPNLSFLRALNRALGDEMERDPARDRWDGLRDATTYATARSRRGLAAPGWSR